MGTRQDWRGYTLIDEKVSSDKLPPAPKGARVTLSEVLERDFCRYETGISTIGLDGGAYAQALTRQCQKKTAGNLKIPFRADLDIVCTTCVFRTVMPGIYLYPDGRCNMCHVHEENRRRDAETKGLAREREEAIAPDTESACDVVLALSGGKDSSSVLHFLAAERKLRVHAVLVDNGFIPGSVKETCRRMCERVGADFTILKEDMKSEVDEVLESSRPSFYPCDVCSRKFKRAIADYSASLGCLRVLSGRNFWARIEPELTGVKKMDLADGRQVRFFSLPFLFGWRREDRDWRLKEIGWDTKGEKIPGLSTNCLVPGMVAEHYFKKTNIHPETALIAQEVICGFLDRETAMEELGISDA